MSRDYPARPSRRQGRGERYPEGRRRWEEGRERRSGGEVFRLFIAVEIPGGATAGLVGWQQQYLAGEKGLRLVPEEQLHITLVFLGHMREEAMGLASEQMDELAGQDPLTAFDATATAMVGLPRGRNPRVIAADIEEPAGRLKEIHRLLTAGLTRKRLYKPERRQFFPHVTVARARGRIRLDLAEIRPEPVKFTAVRITLYNSILKSSGAVHQALKTVQLD